jgi:hypothetical protein
MRRAAFFFASVFLGPLSCVVGCGDPQRSHAIDALGGEQTGVPPGPLHRPGQPCGACHSGAGPGGLEFSLAGTVYQSPTSTTPLVDAVVFFEDGAGRQFQTATNCAGNFFVVPDDFEPAWPVFTKVLFAGLETPMSTPIYRANSCTTCHSNPEGPASVGQVYFAPPGFTFPPSGCP